MEPGGLSAVELDQLRLLLQPGDPLAAPTRDAEIAGHGRKRLALVEHTSPVLTAVITIRRGQVPSPFG
jgi:hypothetical protein